MSLKLNRILKIIFSTIIGLVFGEVLIRIIPANITKLDNSIVEDHRLYSATRNFSVKPNFTKPFTALGKPTIWYFNNYGFRDHPYPTNEINGNVFRVLFLGDSIIMGVGVEDNETLPKQLENILRAKAGSKDRFIEVFNMGIASYSTKQYEATLREFGANFKPDLIVVSIYANDPGEDIMNKQNTTYIRLRAIPDTIFPYPLNAYLETHSKFFLFLVTKYYGFITRFATHSNPLTNSILYGEGWQITEEAITNMQNLAKTFSSNIAFIGIPSIDEVLETGKMPKDREERFTEIGKKHHLFYFDLEQNLKKQPVVKDLFLSGTDIHFTPLGNRVAAELILDYLIKEKLAPGTKE